MKRRGLLIAFGATVLSAAPVWGDSSADEVATRWLSGLRTGTVEQLASATAIPFTYREAWPHKLCSRAIGAKADLAAWLSCVRQHEEFLIRGLGRLDQPQNLQGGISGGSDKAMRLARQIKINGKWFYRFVDDGGAKYHLLILVSPKGVAACVVDVEYESG